MYKDLRDGELIFNIKNDISPNECLREIVHRHSGIYLDMVNIYASDSSPFISKKDLVEDKLYHIYQAVIKYDEDKGAKFSTYLGNEAKWLCLNNYNKNRRRGEQIEDHPTLEILCGKTFDQDSVKKDLLEKIQHLVENHPDNRVCKIFKLRYIVGHKNKVMPWKQVSGNMDMSIQGCINIHDRAIKSIQFKLKDEK